MPIPEYSSLIYYGSPEIHRITALSRPGTELEEKLFSYLDGKPDDLSWFELNRRPMPVFLELLIISYTKMAYSLFIVAVKTWHATCSCITRTGTVPLRNKDSF